MENSARTTLEGSGCSLMPLDPACCVTLNRLREQTPANSAVLAAAAAAAKRQRRRIPARPRAQSPHSGMSEKKKKKEVRRHLLTNAVGQLQPVVCLPQTSLLHFVRTCESVQYRTAKARSQHPASISLRSQGQQQPVKKEKKEKKKKEKKRKLEASEEGAEDPPVRTKRTRLHARRRRPEGVQAVTELKARTLLSLSHCELVTDHGG